MVNDPGSSEELARCEPTEVVTIDDQIGAERSVGIIQLDIEGYETEALFGARRTIARCRPVLILETEPRLEALEWLTCLRYQKMTALNGNTVWIANH